MHTVVEGTQDLIQQLLLFHFRLKLFIVFNKQRLNMIFFTKDISLIHEAMLEGFFKGWPNPPSKQTHLKILKNSSKCIIAKDESTKKVVGFITAITDQTLCAYIPLLEVLESYQNKGIGKKLRIRNSNAFLVLASLLRSHIFHANLGKPPLLLL